MFLCENRKNPLVAEGGPPHPLSFWKLGTSPKTPGCSPLTFAKFWTLTWVIKVVVKRKLKVLRPKYFLKVFKYFLPRVGNSKKVHGPLAKSPRLPVVSYASTLALSQIFASCQLCVDAHNHNKLLRCQFYIVHAC